MNLFKLRGMVLKHIAQPNRLKVLRAERGATQLTVARALGIGQSTYFCIEKGYVEATPEQRQKIARVFGVAESDIWQTQAGA